MDMSGTTKGAQSTIGDRLLKGIFSGPRAWLTGTSPERDLVWVVVVVFVVVLAVSQDWAPPAVPYSSSSSPPSSRPYISSSSAVVLSKRGAFVSSAPRGEGTSRNTAAGEHKANTSLHSVSRTRVFLFRWPAARA